MSIMEMSKTMTMSSARVTKFPRPPLREGRSKGMLAVISALEKKGKSLNWLAGELKTSRQLVCSWNDVPIDYVPRVMKLTDLSYEVIRPDIAKHMQKNKKTTKQRKKRS